MKRIPWLFLAMNGASLPIAGIGIWMHLSATRLGESCAERGITCISILGPASILAFLIAVILPIASIRVLASWEKGNEKEEDR